MSKKFMDLNEELGLNGCGKEDCLGCNDALREKIQTAAETLIEDLKKRLYASGSAWRFSLSNCYYRKGNGSKGKHYVHGKGELNR